MSVRILEPDDFPCAAVEQLKSLGEVTFGLPSDIDPDATVLFIRLAHRIDHALLDRFPALQWLVSPTTGLNHIDLQQCEQREIKVLSLQGRTEFLDHIHATAELTLALALALYRDVPAAAHAVRQGEWNRYPHKGRELHGKTVLLLGYGRIGRLVAPVFKAFGCRVLAHDIRPSAVPDELACEFPGALAETDILSIHVPLTRQNEGLVDHAMLSRLPQHAIVVNTSRGEVIDQNALFDLLDTGSLAGAALDVLQGEPNPVDAILQNKLASFTSGRLLITPHIGGFTKESLSAVETYMTKTLVEAAHAAA